MTSTIATPEASPADRAGRSGRSRAPGSRIAGAKKESSVALLMLAPAAVLIAVFLLVPIGLTFVLAFTNARLVSPEPAQFVGADNFVALFSDATFWASLRNTIVFAVVIVPLQSVLALVLAVLVNSRGRGTTFFRTVYFLPVVTSIVVVSTLWLFLYQKDGLINVLLSKLGITGPDWLGDPHWALLAIILMSAWQAMGFHMIIWLAGLQTIPEELYEAGALDRASRWQQFAHITWPGLRQTRTFILITITITIAAFGLFSQVNIMTQGGPIDSTTTLVFQAVRRGFQQQQTGYASAISLVFFVLVLVVTLVQRFLTRDKGAQR